MCGLLGYVGQDPVDGNALRFASYFLAKRGKHGCGIMLNGKLYDKKAGMALSDLGDISDYIKAKPFVFEETGSNVCLIHARMATKGAHTIENTHPFQYEHKGVLHTFAHNGTLTNEDELCTMYGLQKADFGGSDSKLLGHIIVHHGFDVLNHYKGAAAFLYHRSDQPDSLYCFKGASFNSRTSPTILYEERPLIAVGVGNGYYVCSEDEIILPAVNKPKGDIINISCNVVLKATGNTIKNVFNASKRNTFENFEPATTTYYNDSWGGHNGNYSGRGKNSSLVTKGVEKAWERFSNPANFNTGKVYYWKGLYYKHGTIVTGAFCLMENGSINNTDPEAKTYYFNHGVMVKDMETFNKLNAAGVKFTTEVQFQHYQDLHPEMLTMYGIYSTAIVYNNVYRSFIEPVKPIFSNYWISKENGKDAVVFAEEAKFYKQTPSAAELKMGIDIINKEYTVLQLPPTKTVDLFSYNKNQITKELKDLSEVIDKLFKDACLKTTESHPEEQTKIAALKLVIDKLSIAELEELVDGYSDRLTLLPESKIITND